LCAAVHCSLQASGSILVPLMTGPGFATSLLLVTLGGLLTGAFAAPMKHLRRWRWENIWSAYSLFALVVIPVLAIGLMVPNLWGLYRALPVERSLLILGLGYCWGVGCATFGLGVDRLGMGLGFSLIMGISTLLGTVTPLFMAGKMNLKPVPFALGLGLLLVGIAICGLAGNRRERAAAASLGGPKRSYRAGLIICVVSGVLSSLFNIGMVAGRPVQEMAIAAGAPAWASGNAVWPMLLFGGFLANISYCGYLVRKNRSLELYWKGGWREWAGAFAMGAAWIGGVMMYGAGAFFMGELGPVLGWPMFTALMLVCAYLLGRLAGEWRDAAPDIVRSMNIGVFLSVASLFLIAYSR
jgi:L-rhamnose-H+ transport protein